MGIVLKRSDKIIIINDESFKVYKKFGCEEKLIKLVNCIDTQVFQPLPKRKEVRKYFSFSQEDKIILFVGRLAEVKGIELLVDAFDILWCEKKDIKLIIIGDGEYRQSLERYVRKNGSSKDIVFTGWIPYSELPQLYNCADVFVLPSFREGTSMAMLESLACGVPVVVTTVGGASEIIEEGINGYLLRKRDPRQLASLIKQTFGIKKEQICKTVKNLSAEQASKTMERIFNEIIFQKHIL